MKKLACRYAIVQFLPYPETGEFANAGIVLACPATGYFGYQLETRRYARFTHFFRELDKAFYLRGVAALRDELDRVRRVLANANADIVREAFTALVHPRETILRFSDARAILVDDPEQALAQLYGHYVEHDFVTPEYHEQALEKRVHQLIKGLHLANPFREMRLGDDEFAVRFPLVQTVQEHPVKAIKPLYLAQDDTTAIYNHGDQWLSKLKRLYQRNRLPTQILFTVEAPERADDKRFKAFDEVVRELEQFTRIAQVEEQSIILNFATAA